MQPSKTARQPIHSDAAPAAIGPYSQAIRAGDTVYLSGQIALDPRTMVLVEGGVEAQTRQVLENMGAVLKAAGLAFDDLVKCSIFLKNMNDFAAMNAVYTEFMPQPPPARETVEVSRLPKDVIVEISAVAWREGSSG